MEFCTAAAAALKPDRSVIVPKIDNDAKTHAHRKELKSKESASQQVGRHVRLKRHQVTMLLDMADEEVSDQVLSILKDDRCHDLDSGSPCVPQGVVRVVHEPSTKIWTPEVQRI